MFEEWHHQLYNTPLGEIVIQDDGYGIARVEWADHCKLLRGSQSETDYMAMAYKQILEYFRGERQKFDFPMRLKGTAFQLKVWRCLLTIPYGEVWSYQQVAAAIGNEKAVRAIGMANNQNPLMIVIPCHRVVTSTGKLSGYCGGVERKQALIDLEKRFCEK